MAEWESDRSSGAGSPRDRRAGPTESSWQPDRRTRSPPLRATSATSIRRRRRSCCSTPRADPADLWRALSARRGGARAPRIEIHVRTTVVSLDAETISVCDADGAQRTIAAMTTVWRPVCAPLRCGADRRGDRSADRPARARERAGRLLAASHPEIFVVGDMMDLEASRPGRGRDADRHARREGDPGEDRSRAERKRFATRPRRDAAVSRTSRSRTSAACSSATLGWMMCCSSISSSSPLQESCDNGRALTITFVGRSRPSARSLGDAAVATSSVLKSRS